jgi:hypothetical protein
VHYRRVTHSRHSVVNQPSACKGRELTGLLHPPNTSRVSIVWAALKNHWSQCRLKSFARVLLGARASRKLMGYQIGVLTKFVLVTICEINKYGCLGGSHIASNISMFFDRMMRPQIARISVWGLLSVDWFKMLPNSGQSPQFTTSLPAV